MPSTRITPLLCSCKTCTFSPLGFLMPFRTHRLLLWNVCCDHPALLWALCRHRNPHTNSPGGFRNGVTPSLVCISSTLSALPFANTFHRVRVCHPELSVLSAVYTRWNIMSYSSLHPPQSTLHFVQNEKYLGFSYSPKLEDRFHTFVKPLPWCLLPLVWHTPVSYFWISTRILEVSTTLDSSCFTTV